MASKDVEVSFINLSSNMLSSLFQKQVKISMHTIIKYVYWMKNKDRMSVLDEDAKSGFKVLFDLLKMKWFIAPARKHGHR